MTYLLTRSRQELQKQEVEDTESSIKAELTSPMTTVIPLMMARRMSLKMLNLQGEGLLRSKGKLRMSGSRLRQKRRRQH